VRSVLRVSFEVEPFPWSTARAGSSFSSPVPLRPASCVTPASFLATRTDVPFSISKDPQDGSSKPWRKPPQPQPPCVRATILGQRSLHQRDAREGNASEDYLQPHRTEAGGTRRATAAPLDGQTNPSFARSLAALLPPASRGRRLTTGAKNCRALRLQDRRADHTGQPTQGRHIHTQKEGEEGRMSAHLSLVC
jgi:hypothetical protein